MESHNNSVLIERHEALREEVGRLKARLARTRAFAYRLERPTPIHVSLIQEVYWFLSTFFNFGLMRALRYARTYRVLRKSGLFDPKFYALQVGLPTQNGPALLNHYVMFGHMEGRDPCPGFSSSQYLDFYPDVAAAGSEPLSHFLLTGRAEGRFALLSKSAPNDPSNAISEGIFNLEERERYSWPMAAMTSTSSRLGENETRPDDIVLTEGRKGDEFLDQFDLLRDNPDFSGAIKALSEIDKRHTTDPFVSVIVPIYGELPYTLNCLDALLRHHSKHSFEILIGDDCSPDASEKWLSKLNSVRLIRHATNCGFIKNCNLTAKQARGRYVVFLNNDTRVVDGWLDHLIDSFSLFPKAGLIGSKLFYHDGTLQEAGGIVWRDGSAWNYGRGDDPNRPRYSYARQVDYVSGCAIALPTKIWLEMDGFDTHFAPAYCEDVDLCFRLREVGYETWFQPQSRIIHYEGRTSGVDTSVGIKAYQVKNTQKLYDRWQERLSSHRANGQLPWLERERVVYHRVLVLDACNPTPWQDAGSLAVINLFRYYQALGYQVSFAAQNFLYEARAVGEMQAMGVQVMYSPYESSLPELLQKYGSLYDSVHVVREDVAAKSLELIRQFAPQAVAIYQNCDLHYLRLERQAVVENNIELAKRAEHIKRRELQLSRDYDLTITHSEVEKEILKVELPAEDVLVMPLIEEVVENHSPFAARKDVMFLGGYGHPPNVDAAHWLIDKIWPRLAARFPEARLLLVGANPPESILMRATDRIIITGLVEDLKPWFAQTRVFLAALRFGAGAKGKVLASLAHGVPVVATTIAAEGLPLQDGDTVFLADTVDEIVEKTVSLYESTESKWSVLSQNAQTYINLRHNFASGVRLLRNALATLGETI